MPKYRVHLVESERGWGSERWHEDFDTIEAARARVEAVNKENPPGPVPDYYVAASRDIEIVD
jgi:hypothetical protein